MADFEKVMVLKYCDEKLKQPTTNRMKKKQDAR